MKKFQWRWQNQEICSQFQMNLVRTCDITSMKINVYKSKVLVFQKDERANIEKVVGRNWKRLETKYLQLRIITAGIMKKEMTLRLHEGRKIWGTMEKL